MRFLTDFIVITLMLSKELKSCIFSDDSHPPLICALSFLIDLFVIIVLHFYVQEGLVYCHELTLTLFSLYSVNLSLSIIQLLLLLSWDLLYY